MSSIGHILRMALVCGALGLLLYVGLSYAVTLPGFAQLLGLVLIVALGVIVTGLLRQAWRSGEFPEKSDVLSRQRRPVAYWLAMAWYGAWLIAALGIALLALQMLIDLWSGSAVTDAVAACRFIIGTAAAAI